MSCIASLEKSPDIAFYSKASQAVGTQQHRGANAPPQHVARCLVAERPAASTATHVQAAAAGSDGTCISGVACCNTMFDKVSMIERACNSLRTLIVLRPCERAPWLRHCSRRRQTACGCDRSAGEPEKDCKSRAAYISVRCALPVNGWLLCWDAGLTYSYLCCTVLQEEDLAKLPWVLLDMNSPWFRLTCAVVFVLEVIIVRCIAIWEIRML